MKNINIALDRAAEYVQEMWQRVVMGETPGAPVLKLDTFQQRQKYAESIVIESGDNPAASYLGRYIQATDPVAAETEHGKGPWDMKPFLLNYKGDGTKAKTSKDGHRFNIIPFRHGASSGNENSNFRPMPKDIHQMAKALKPSVSNGNGGMNWGGRLGTQKNYPRQQKSIAISAGGQTRYVKYKHEAGIFDGMVKISAPYGKTTQNKYLTFRMVSDKSPDNSWWHPGRAAQPHVGWVADYCRPNIEKMLYEAARQDLVNMMNFKISITAEV